MSDQHPSDPIKITIAVTADDQLRALRLVGNLAAHEDTAERERLLSLDLEEIAGDASAVVAMIYATASLGSTLLNLLVAANDVDLDLLDEDAMELARSRTLKVLRERTISAGGLFT